MKVDRNRDLEKVRSLRSEGLTWKEIGQQFEVTGQRVQQVFADDCADINPQPPTRFEMEPEVIDFLETYGPMPKKALFEQFPTVTEAQLARMKLPRNLILASRVGVDHFTDEDIYAALRLCAKDMGEPVTVKKYLTWHRDHKEHPSTAAVHLRMSWTQACEEAGVSAGKPRRAEYTKKHSDDFALQCVAEFEAAMREEGLRPTYARYEEMQRQRPDWPSGTTLRINTGMTWQEALLASAAY